MSERGLSEEQRLMRQSCRDFVDDVVIPFIRGNWQREWNMAPEQRLPPEILEGAQKVGIRTLGVPEEFGGLELDKATEVQTFAIIAEEIARGDSGLSDKPRSLITVSLRANTPPYRRAAARLNGSNPGYHGLVRASLPCTGSIDGRD